MSQETDTSQPPKPPRATPSACRKCAVNANWRLTVNRNTGLAGIIRTVHASCLNCGHHTAVTNRELNRFDRLMDRLAQAMGVTRYPEPAPVPPAQTCPPNPARS